MYGQGQGVPQSERKATVWYRKASDQRNAEAQFNLGAMYDQGRGVPQSNKEAAVWYQKAADQGNAEAQFNLVVMYDHVLGGASEQQGGRGAVSKGSCSR